MRDIQALWKDDRVSNMVMIDDPEHYAGRIDNGRRTLIFFLGIDENGWEHVSVSFANQLLWKRGELPSWDEMARIKDIFWDDEEEVYQIHPPRSEYVNIGPVLHLWRPKNGKRLMEVLR